MRNFKKAILKIMCFMLCLALVSSVFIGRYLIKGTHGMVDRAEIKEMSGEIDTIAIGGSQLANCFVPSIFDEELSGVSYNACANASSIRERYIILKSYIERNDIKRVILDLSYDSLYTDYSDERSVESAIFASDQIIDNKERLSMLLQGRSLPDLYSIYKYMMFNAFLDVYLDTFEHYTGEFDEYKKQGFFPQIGGPFVSPDTTGESKGTVEMPSIPLDVNMQWLDEIFSICDEKGIELIVVSTPVTEYLYDTYKNPETAQALLATVCASHDVLYLDFNNMEKTDPSLIDNALFGDENHMNAQGAILFTQKLAAILAKQSDG